jgi:uncharacterized protein YprB with RNaseH-like and TPR domain
MAPLHNLRKDELVWMGTHKCRHSHTYLEHYSCYLKEHGGPQERIGFLDIEASNLDADFGIMLSYCILDSESKKIYHGVLRRSDFRLRHDQTDKRIVQQCINDMMRFDRIVTFYGRKYDIPFIRTRALALGLEFPAFGSIIHTDVYYIAKYKLKLHSNSLENVSKMILGKTEKTHIESRYWLGGTRGDPKSLKYILDHNKKDVRDLEKVYLKLIDFQKLSRTSA